MTVLAVVKWCLVWINFFMQLIQLFTVKCLKRMSCLIVFIYPVDNISVVTDITINITFQFSLPLIP